MDPLALPARFSIRSERAELAVFLEPARAVIQGRLSSGVPLFLDVPVSAYRGVAARLVPVGSDGALRVSLELLHADPALTLTLAVADDPADIAADWQAWGKALTLPLLLVTPDGKVTTAEVARRPAATTQRRARRFLAGRRPRFLARRKTGRPGPAERLEAREIIARN